MDKLMMRWVKWIPTMAYDIIIWSLASVYGFVVGISISGFQELLLVVIWATLIQILFDKPFWIYVILIVALLSGMMLHRFAMPMMGLLLDRIMEVSINLISHLNGEEAIKPENAMVVWVLMIILLSIYTGYVLFKNKKTGGLFFIYMISFVYYWYAYVDLALKRMLIFLGAYFVLMSIRRYLLIKKSLDKKGVEGFEDLFPIWLQTAIQYAILVIVLAFFLPKSYDSVKWDALNQTIYDLFSGIEDMRGGSLYTRGSVEASPFDLTFTGYQEYSARLGGPIAPDDQLIMTVRADHRYYLRGNVRSIYTGTHWENSDMPYTTFRLNEDFKKLTEEQDPQYREKSIDILHHYFASKTIFGPWMTVEVIGQGNQKIRVNEDHMILYPEGVYKGEGYTIRIQQPVAYQVLLAMEVNQRKEGLPHLNLYLDLPETVTHRTRVLTQRITEEMKDDYHKAVAIESFLRKSFQYDLNGEMLPENKEFTDFFLFESQKGYCTYFATAMAVMLRMEGIPSRYVEGYVVGERIAPNVYEVRQDDAHAWVEAFIEPVGWMTFEPTPSLPLTHPQENENDWSGIDEGLREDERLTPGKKMREDTEYDYIWEDAPSEIDVVEGNQRLQQGLLLFLMGLLAVVPIKLILGILYDYRLEKKIKQWPTDQRVLFDYQKILYLLDLSGYPCQLGETHDEYASRMAYKFYYRDEVGIMEVTDIFVRSKYSSSQATEEEAQAVKLFRDKLDKRLKKKLGVSAYWYKKYFCFKHRLNQL